MAVFSLKQLLEAGGIFRISRTSDARPYGSDEVRMGTNLSVSFADSSPWEGEPWVWRVYWSAFPEKGSQCQYS